MPLAWRWVAEDYRSPYIPQLGRRGAVPIATRPGDVVEVEDGFYASESPAWIAHRVVLGLRSGRRMLALRYVEEDVISRKGELRLRRGEILGELTREEILEIAGGRLSDAAGRALRIAREHGWADEDG